MDITGMGLTEAALRGRATFPLWTDFTHVEDTPQARLESVCRALGLADIASQGEILTAIERLKHENVEARQWLHPLFGDQDEDWIVRQPVHAHDIHATGGTATVVPND